MSPSTTGPARTRAARGARELRDHRQRAAHAAGEAGITLVELMISLLLFSILAAGAFFALMAQQQSSRRQSSNTTALENARSTLDAIVRRVQTIRAGNPLGAWALENANSPSPTYFPICTKTAVSTLNAAAAGGDFPNGVYVPVLYVFDTTPDWFGIIQVDGYGWATLRNPLTPGTTNIDLFTTDGAPPALRNAHWAVASDFSQNTKLIRLNMDASTTCAGLGPTCTRKTDMSGTIPLPPTVPRGYPLLRARPMLFYRSTFFFGTEVPTMVVWSWDISRYQPLATGISNFQVAFWVDRDGNGLPATEDKTAAGADEWIGNVVGEHQTFFNAWSGSSTCDALTRLRAVRLSIVAQATADEPGAQPTLPALENHPGGSAGGKYHVVLTTTVALRFPGQ